MASATGNNNNEVWGRDAPSFHSTPLTPHGRRGEDHGQVLCDRKRDAVPGNSSIHVHNLVGDCVIKTSVPISFTGFRILSADLMIAILITSVSMDSDADSQGESELGYVGISETCEDTEQLDILVSPMHFLTASKAGLQRGRGN